MTKRPNVDGNIEHYTVEAYYPENIIYYHVNVSEYTQASFTCFNPAKVYIDGKMLPQTLVVITFDDISPTFSPNF